MTQNEEVLVALRHRSLTPYDAARFGCLRLAARVKDLRDQGHQIHTEIVKNVTGKRYARYTLKEDKSNGEPG